MPQPDRPVRVLTPPAPKTIAQVLQQRIGETPDTVDAVIQCGCGTKFKVVIPSPPGDDMAVTSAWYPPAPHTMDCPGCLRRHRVRTTVVVNVEEEKRSSWRERLNQMAAKAGVDTEGNDGEDPQAG